MLLSARGGEADKDPGHHPSPGFSEFPGGWFSYDFDTADNENSRLGEAEKDPGHHPPLEFSEFLGGWLAYDFDIADNEK